MKIFKLTLASLLLIISMILIRGGAVAAAIYDPLSVPNNVFGVHILETSEIFSAAKLVNSHGGAWGYVTIPIRTDDRDKSKWQDFMKNCLHNQIIPILRISSYAVNNFWVNPPDSELTDFANFLNDLSWPVKNRYIIVYNEPNHAHEWGGYVSPQEYARILIKAYEIFKSVSQDFFIISAGLDMSAPTSKSSMDALIYLRKMSLAYPNWYQSIDGLAVHAYPNPDYKMWATQTGRHSPISYRYIQSLLSSLGYPAKPLFITETAYLGKKAGFFKVAFSQVWTDKNIVAVTPFVLFAGSGDFMEFSLLDINNQPTSNYNDIYALSKKKGSPLLNEPKEPKNNGLSYVSSSANNTSKGNFIQKIIQFFFPRQPTLTINNKTIKVELADNPRSRQKGLSRRKNLPRDKGMLFVFEKPQIQTFWMKDMNFPLDFIWINNNQVVNMHQNIPFPSNISERPAVVSSTVPVNLVLEVNAGFISQNNIKIGDKVMLNLY